jgi:chlorinating enzyme
MKKLSADVVTTFHEQGYYLYHQQLFSGEKFARLTEIFEEQLAQKGEKLSDELDTPHFRDERLLEFLLSDEVLDLVESIIGPDIALWSSHFICKDPYTGRATPWHEDSAFWKGRLSNYEQVVTIWLAIDRSTRENGCMKVIPGTHRNGGFSEYVAVDSAKNTFKEEIKDAETVIDDNRAVYFELEPGECSFHDGRIIHGADANISPYRRCGYTMRYFPTSVFVYPEMNRGHHIWLARGKDLAGNTYDEM